MGKIFLKTKYSGQTLIETLVALFILIMGISAAVGMAIYAFGTSSAVVKQIVATGLAREGVEAVRNMRDTNWLKQTTIDTDCYNYADTAANNANCFKGWMNQFYCIDPTSNNGNCNGVGATTMAYFLGFDASAKDPWFLTKEATNYGLNFDPNNSGTGGFYTPTINGVSCASASGRADFCRKVIITEDSTAPFNQNIGPLLKVQSQVWWADKKCPRATDYAQALPGCRVELDSYLTNWKNY
jgi:type II secretory pathway pseudopilin PulG